MPRLPDDDVPSRLGDILAAFKLWVEDQPQWNELTTRRYVGYVADYAAWLHGQVLEAHPLDDEHGRDVAVGFYKRTLFARGMQPKLINIVLQTLGIFYAWWGLGAHTVPLLSLRRPPGGA